MSYAISLFKSRHDKSPQIVHHDWAAICRYLACPVVRAEKDGPLFSPATFKPPERKKANVTEISMLVLDYDHHAALDEDLQPWLDLGFCFGVYTTHSHRRVVISNPTVEERFRIIIPLSEPVPSSLFSRLWQWAAKVSGGKIDPQAKDESRMFYMPAKALPDAPYEYHLFDGKTLNWRKIIETAEESSRLVEQMSKDTDTNSDYSTWDELNAELRRRIMYDPTAKQNGDGFYHCRARCHVPKSDAGIMFNPATGAVRCQKGCFHAVLLHSFGLPEQPNGKHGHSQPGKHLSDDALASLRNLKVGATIADIEKAFRDFADAVKPLDELARGIAREEAIKILKERGFSSPARLIDVAMPKLESDEEESKGLDLRDPALWPEPVDGAVMLDEITAVVSRFLSASKHTFKAIALWIVYTYAFDLFDISPLLAITSPEKRCGKTTLLTLLYALAPRPLAVANITPSALFRTVEKYQPTLLIDEADSFLTDNEELRGILNSGHRKATSYIIRTTGEDYEPRRFTTWSPKAIALIGALPGTLEDRAIIIRLQRKRANDNIERLRFDRLGEFEHLRRRSARWVDEMKKQLRAADPDIPSEITNDRARDNWRPLFAIADTAGGDWPREARIIARTMAGEKPDSESARTLLLGDLKVIFAEDRERLTSDEIIQSLIEMESRPWAEYKSGKALSKVGLARLLKPFGVEPTKWRERDQTQRGYLRNDFEDVFARYLMIESPHSPQVLKSTTYNEFESPQDAYSVATGNGDNSLKTKSVASVATQKEEVEREVLEI